jgi:hypothetical protein
MATPAILRSSPWHLLRPLVAVGLIVFAAIQPETARAAESAAAPARGKEETRRFDISSGDAFTTLRQFSVQSGEQLIYQADSLEGVRTDAVQGRYTSREALGRMLVRTALAVTQDARTGTLAITRIPRRGEQPDGDIAPTDHSTPAQKKKPQP